MWMIGWWGGSGREVCACGQMWGRVSSVIPPSLLLFSSFSSLTLVDPCLSSRIPPSFLLFRPFPLSFSFLLVQTPFFVFRSLRLVSSCQRVSVVCWEVYSDQRHLEVTY